MKKDKIYIIGTGGHAQVVIDAILNSGFDVSGIFDDNKSLIGQYIFNIPVLGKIEKVREYDDSRFVVAIGDNETRMQIVEKLGFPDERFFTVIHPSAVIGKNVEIGVGSMVLGGVVINTGTSIGKHCIINTSASIDHHNKISDFVHVAPGTHTGGNVTIEEGSFLGIGVSVIPGIKISKWSIIGAGSVAIEDVPDYATVVGVPGRVIKRRQDI
jgi:acetyltransferase EpsM